MVVDRPEASPVLILVLTQSWKVRGSGFLQKEKGPFALTPDTVELTPNLGALSPRSGPVQDPVLTEGLVTVQPSRHKKADRSRYRGTSLIKNSTPLGP